MRQESALAIEGAAVAMETIGKEEHDVGEVLDLVPYVAVGDLAEPQRGHALPDFEGFSDSLMGLILSHFGSIVLYTKRERKSERQRMEKRQSKGKERRGTRDSRESRAEEKEIERRGRKGKKERRGVIYITDKSPRNFGQRWSSVGILQYTQDYFSVRAMGASEGVSTSTTVKL